jgi:hypothetical protein
LRTDRVAPSHRSPAGPESVSAELATALKTWAQHRIDDPTNPDRSPGLSVDDVSCTMTGGQAFRCVGTYSNGMTERFDVAVGADGHTWSTV